MVGIETLSVRLYIAVAIVMLGQACRASKNDTSRLAFLRMTCCSLNKPSYQGKFLISDKMVIEEKLIYSIG